MTELPVAVVWGLKATPLLAAAWVVTALLRRASASARHFVWVLAIGAAMLLPVASGLAPRLEVALPWLATPEAGAPVVADVGTAGPAPAATWDPPGTSAGSAATAPAVAVGPAAPNPPAPAPAARSAPRLLGLAWAVGAGLVALLVAISLWRTHGLARGARRPAHAGAAREIEELARRLEIGRRVTVLQSAREVMPMTWGARRPHILVPASFASWPAERRQAVLLHELAHVKRWDWLTQLAARLTCALYWWHPLAWLAARRLREEREVACDDLVLAHGTLASTYAGDLLEIARSFRAPPVTALAGVAMARRSQLADRLLAVLDVTRSRASLTPRHGASAAGLALVILLPIAGLTAGAAEVADRPPDAAVAAAPSAPPAPAAPASSRDVPPVRRSAAQGRGALLCDWAAPSERNSSSTSINDDRMMIQLSRDDCSITVRAEGEITFSDDDRDVARLARRGSFEIEERSGRSRRRVEVAEADGRLERRWFVDGSEQSYGDDARAWLGDALLVLARRAGINAEARALRILRSGGTDALIAEIALLQSDHVAGKYYRVLFERADLSSAQLARLLDDAASRIDSDHELGRVLASVAARRPGDPAVHQAYVRATERIESDFEHGRALEALAGAVDLDAATLEAMLTTARRIESDFQRASLLLAVADRYPSGRPLPGAYLVTVGDMKSDHERGRVLGRLLERDRLAPSDRARVLEVVGRIGSDHTQGQLLQAVVAGGPLDDATRAAFFHAVDRIGSDFTRQEVLRAVVAGRPDDATTLAVLEAARGIGSDHAKAEVLVAVATRGLEGERLRDAYVTVAESIGSRFERERVMRAAGLQRT